MKTSTILQRAKKHLGYGPYDGICFAVDSVSGISAHDADRVRLMIQDRIQPFTYANRWLAYTMVYGKPADRRSVYSGKMFRLTSNWIRTQTDSDIQAWRLRWMDSMIAEFKAKGD